MSEAVVERMTLAEFLSREDGTDTRYELVDGTAVAKSLPPVAHGVLAARVCRVIASAPQSLSGGPARPPLP